METLTTLPTLLTVITTAAIDAINPCAIGVMILMISAIMGAKQSLRRLVMLGLIYTGAVFITYLLAGLGLLYFLSTIPLFVVEYLSVIVGSIIIIAGILEIKDYFWYARGFSLTIPAVFSHKIEKMSATTSATGIALLGFFVAAVELPCTGAPYLAIITLLSQQFNLMAFFLLVLYNIIFVAPLLVILFLVVFGVELQNIHTWKQINKGAMRLAIGLLLVALGWLLIFIANGIINFG
ncbi:MAG: cytochrome c bioproteinis transmembrane protein [Parcubacteria group bacterium Gr01-1014_48]|nr:MAG: cytochrome c bioproteinis transmembrane protein [Parcubacteria group bacterium Greene0416_14]TSC74430.1 MAG: cytochrome c bioproteinis transmembrane protein [Parcubacteria group bacterium Gr01-1014_48]TSD01283.1 MAG: cytochrome c bioproteinis transmembrane protein [Parcubacteria group bacterium Greene1014_15]TSD08396.1 MAG: cytochrome c bioproteinis transmembrane protein [Parcubacteria group bacterium Greene0714_4]